MNLIACYLYLKIKFFELFYISLQTFMIFIFTFLSLYDFLQGEIFHGTMLIFVLVSIFANVKIAKMKRLRSLTYWKSVYKLVHLDMTFSKKTIFDAFTNSIKWSKVTEDSNNEMKNKIKTMEVELEKEKQKFIDYKQNLKLQNLNRDFKIE